MRKYTEADIENTRSALKKWLWMNGKDTIDKFNDFERSNFTKTLIFSGKLRDIIIIIFFLL